MSSNYDAIIVGGGHNALVAAAYLAGAGQRTLLCERLGHVGGAAVSEQPWPGVAARLSRYSYLVSLLPRHIIDDLGLRIELRRRRYSSYTPDPSDPRRGILVDNEDAAGTAASFLRVTGLRGEAERFAAFGDRIAPAAQRLFPTVTEPLRRRSEVRALLGDALFSAIAEQPLAELMREAVQSDIARGILLTDGLIGTFAASDDESLKQNRCFLYHVIGGGTGDWDVPVGGMGQVSAELERAARDAGAEIRTHAEVVSITPDGEVALASGESVHGQLVLGGVTPAVLAKLLAAGGAITAPAAGVSSEAGVIAPEGAQLKVNMLLRRLPQLHDDSVDPRAAFAGTFHVNETMTQLDDAFAVASSGGIPDPLPAEIYCHSLTDPSILSPELQSAGAQTLTLFGLHVPHRLVGAISREELLAAAERSVDSVLAEPLANCLWETPDGSPCIEARTTADLEESLGMSGGDIFHGTLSWPWAEDAEPLETAAQRWGVATAHPKVLICGSGARRGGAVSGIGGHNAAMAALELLSR